jgi:glutamate--cysteine ligase
VSVLYGEVTRGGLAPRIKGIRVGELARELLAIAAEGLKRQAARDAEGRDESRYLEPVMEQVERGHTKAEELLRLWTGPWERRARPLVEACALRA